MKPLVLLLALLLFYVSLCVAEENPVTELWKGLKQLMSAEQDERFQRAAAAEASAQSRLRVLQAEATETIDSLHEALTDAKKKLGACLASEVQKEIKRLNATVTAKDEEIFVLKERVGVWGERIEALNGVVKELNSQIAHLERELSISDDDRKEARSQLAKHKEFVALADRATGLRKKYTNYNTISANGKWPVLVVFTLGDWPSTTLHRYFDSEKNATEFLTSVNAHLWEIRDVCHPSPACEQLEYGYSYDEETQRRTFTITTPSS